MNVAIASPHVEAEILPDGGILWKPRFRRADDSWAEPLAVAPWADEPAIRNDATMLAYIRTLGGAFLGLPFGGGVVPASATSWTPDPGEAPLHGHGATATWSIAKRSDHAVVLALDFPDDDPIASVTQVFECAADTARIDICVTITARRDDLIAVGYHPILRLPDDPAALELRIGFTRGYGAPFDAGKQRATAAGSIFSALAAVPAKQGTAIDLSRLPRGPESEELLLLGRVTEPVVARFHDAGYDLTLDWDRTLLPNCLIWYHDRAAAPPPWGNRFRGIGLEPSASAFDLARAASVNPNPLTASGERTAIAVFAAAPTVLRFSLRVTDFA